MLSLEPVVNAEQVEWLRVKRSDPALYKYFRQDRPLTVRDQQIWWSRLDRNSVRLYIIEHDGEKVGYAGFNPFSRASGRAEFGLFVVPEHQHKGYATQALRMLLNKGFEEFNLSTIYSDCLDYPHENRFEFYRLLGFEAFPREHHNIRYKKQGEWVNSIKFFMTKDAWLKSQGTARAQTEQKKNGKDRHDGLEPAGKKAVAVKRRPGRPRKS